MTDSYTATIDRIEDEVTIMRLETDEETREQLELDPTAVPAAGRHEGAVFEIELSAGTLEAIEYRPENERERHERARERFDRLSERLDEE